MKPKLIIVDGAQGVGKSSVCRILREKMTSTNLHSLSGVKHNNEWTSFYYHNSYLDLAHSLADIESGLNLIFERSFLSEKVYCDLGFKKYNFEDQSNELIENLDALTSKYDVHIFILGASMDVFTQRLQRDKVVYQNASFSVENSIKQQRRYVANMMHINEHSKKINTMLLTTDYYSPEELAQEIMEMAKVI